MCARVRACVRACVCLCVGVQGVGGVVWVGWVRGNAIFFCFCSLPTHLHPSIPPSSTPFFTPSLSSALPLSRVCSGTLTFSVLTLSPCFLSPLSSLLSHLPSLFLLLLFPHSLPTLSPLSPRIHTHPHPTHPTPCTPCIPHPAPTTPKNKIRGARSPAEQSLFIFFVPC